MLITILKRLGLGVRIGASIGVTVALCVLMVRWLNSYVHSANAHFVGIVHTAYHAIQAEVLRAHHSWLNLNGTFTPGDLVVGLATLLVAVFTWKGAHGPSALDKRERKYHEMHVQGIIRLVLGELAVISTSIEQSLVKDHWHWVYPLPDNTWERDGALIAGALSEDEAATIIEMYTHLDNWKAITAQAHQQYPNAGSLSLHPEHKSILGKLQGSISDVSWYLRKLAYPDACDRDCQLAYEQEFLQQRIERLERGPVARSQSVI